MNNNSNILNYIDFKPRFNLYSVFWFFINFILLCYFSLHNVKLCLFYFSLGPNTIYSYIPLKNDLIIFLYLIILLFFAFYFVIRTLYVFFCYVCDIIRLYSRDKKEPLPYIKYKSLKQLMKIEKINNSIEIGLFSYKTSPDKVQILVKGNPVCSNFFTYVVLVSAYYTTFLTKGIENTVQKLGVKYYSNKETKKDYNKEVNIQTELLIKSLLRDVEKIQEESKNYFKQVK